MFLFCFLFIYKLGSSHGALFCFIRWNLFSYRALNYLKKVIYESCQIWKYSIDAICFEGCHPIISKIKCHGENGMIYISLAVSSEIWNVCYFLGSCLVCWLSQHGWAYATVHQSKFSYQKCSRLIGSSR